MSLASLLTSSEWRVSGFAMNMFNEGRKPETLIGSWWLLLYFRILESNYISAKFFIKKQCPASVSDPRVSQRVHSRHVSTPEYPGRAMLESTDNVLNSVPVDYM